MKKKTKLVIVAMLTLILMGTLFSVSGSKLNAETPSNIGVLKEEDVSGYGWLKAKEEEIKKRFLTVYEKELWNEKATEEVTIVELDKARHAMFQVYGENENFEGVIYFNEISSDKALVITDPIAFLELQSILNVLDDNDKPNNDKNGLLLDIVEFENETYYVTDRRNENGIFKIVEETIEGETVKKAEYLTDRIGIGTGTYGDIMWAEYVNAYKFATHFMESLGLPLGKVARYDYTTRDLNNSGDYVGETTSLKTYTKQQFENGWIMQARMQIRNADGSLGGHQAVQHPAAPILNEMYNLVIGLENNSNFDVTGAPISIEYTIDGVKMQNFEYGYVKIVDGVAEYIPERIVDSKGTEMDRRIGATYENWDSWRGRGKNHNEYLVTWERLRVAQNFRDTFGQIIRDERINNQFAKPSLRGVAPVTGLWFGFGGGKEHIGLGAASIFIYHTYWYLDAYELAPGFNSRAKLVDAKENIGRPISEFSRTEKYQYQYFEGGLVFNHNNNKGSGIDPIYIMNDQIAEFMGTHETVEEAINDYKIEVKFLDKDGNLLKTVDVPFGELAIELAPEAPEVLGMEFKGWLPDASTKQIFYPTEFKAEYGVSEGVPEEGTIGYLNFDVKESTGKFWYENTNNIIDINVSDLYNAWRNGNTSVSDAILESGLPIYADDSNLVTTLWHYQIVDGKVVKNQTIGKIPATVTSLKSFRANVTINESIQKVISDSFGDTYIYVWDHLGYLLGLPVGLTTVETRTAVTSIFETANTTTFNVIIQEFENGFIMQEEYTHAAFPLYGNMLTEWQRLGGLNGEKSLGTPMSLPIEYEGTTYQNFTNGYMSHDGENFTVKYGVVKVDNKGRELDGRAGLTEGRNNVKLGHKDFETEMLRMFEAYMVAFTKTIDLGYNLNEVGNGAKFIHEWGGMGVSNSFKNSGSNSDVWGLPGHINIVLKTPYDNAYIIKDEFITKYAENGMREALGFPVSNEFVLDINVDDKGVVSTNGLIKLTVSFQNFVGGYVRKYTYNDAVIVQEFFDGKNVNQLGKVIVDGEEFVMDTFTLSETEEVDVTALESKIKELLNLKAGVLNLDENADLKNLPKENKYAPKALLDEINEEITRIRSLIEEKGMTASEVLDEIEIVEDLILELENSIINGEKNDDVKPAPVNPDQKPASLTWLWISLGVIAFVGIVFTVLKFTIMKKNK